LKQQVNELQEANNLLMNNNQILTHRLNQLERPSSPFASQQNLKQVRRTPIQEVC
jgi:FtsZ-binding cell division protein ZapB